MEGIQKCFTAEIARFRTQLGRGRVKYTTWLNEKAVKAQWQTAF